MSIEDISVKIFRQRCAQDLASHLWNMGWLMSVLSFNDRLVWLQATKAGRRIEAEVRGLPDLHNACTVLLMQAQKEDGAAKAAT
jgi:hypothetical protein